MSKTLLNQLIFLKMILKFVSMKIESSEPVWIANFKKSIASQLQLDVTGVRSGNHGDRIPSGSNSAVVTYEVIESVSLTLSVI